MLLGGLFVAFLVTLAIAIALFWRRRIRLQARAGVELALANESHPVHLAVERRDEIPPPPTLPPQAEPEEEDDSLAAFVRTFPALPAWAHLVRVARPPLPTRIVFLHGFAGFAELRMGRLASSYFRGVPARLRGRGIDASFLRVPPFASITVRATELTRALRALGPGRTHLVAHSMGGLDARFALAHLGLQENVSSLVTVGTPHRGTPIADASSRLFRGSQFFQKKLGSVLDLTTARMAEFEAETPDLPGVQYACILASPRRVRSA